MTDAATEVPLPFSVDRMIEEICVQKLLPMPNVAARKSLSAISEDSAVDVLKKIGSTSKQVKNFSGYILYMVNKYGSMASRSSYAEPECIPLSPQHPSSSSSSISDSPRESALYDSPTSKQFFDSPCYGSKGVSSNTTQYFVPPYGSHGSVHQQNSSSACSSLKDVIPNSGIRQCSYSPSATNNVFPRQKQFVTFPNSTSDSANRNHVTQPLSGSPSASQSGSPFQKKQVSPCSPFTPDYKISQQSLVLSHLQFRKLFMVHSYVGRNKLEDVVSVEAAIRIKSMENTSMLDFENWLWNEFGHHYCEPSDRAMYLDWDSGKTHLYHCYVCPDGSYQFKGPYLDTKKTHLQRAIGDENVLIVKFAEGADMHNMTIGSFNVRVAYEKIAEAGILVGLRCYRFFVFKDGGKDVQKKGKEDRKKGTGPVKCYFVRRESVSPWDEKDTYVLNNKTAHDARCLFMHVHMVSSLAKYIARFSLILSTTIKLQVDLASVLVEEIDDIPCCDDNGCIMFDEDGEPLIHTDGTGFISEDLALLIPNDFYDAKYIKDKDFERFELVQPETGFLELRGREVSFKEPPLLIQCRLFNEGSAVKGTLLVNKKLKPRTIQVRRSMIKVEKDSRLSNTESFNSLEIVAISRKPRTAKLSRHLIALLSIGGVPKEYFLGLLESTLKDAQRVCSDPRAAFRVAHIYQHIDDSGISLEMFGACIPLNEPYFQYRLSQMANEERKGLGEGKFPISDSFYLMGTTDPTGILDSDEVCIIHENGPVSGKVLVYRNPGLHFGDIHVLNARYVTELEGYIGNGKYAIFFSTKGRRSVANEIANGDFDGDLYWVSRNSQLLHHFKVSEPWKRSYSAPKASNKKPNDFSHEELEHELFKLLFSNKTHSSAAGIAADNWMAFMDRFLTLQDDDADEKQRIKEKMLKLIDLYYEALDAPKTGKRIVVPSGLTAKQYPHYMNRKTQYHSTSILGLIYDEFQRCKSEKLPKQEISKLPYFNINIPDACLNLWKERYETYRWEMSKALRYGDESKKESANSVVKKYKQMLYGAADFKDSTREIDQIYDEALAIYHVCYDYAKSRRDVAKCGFAWRVAGSALCAYHRKIHSTKTGEREITFLPSSFDSIF